MKKLPIFLISLILISVGFLSGCNEQDDEENSIIQNQVPTSNPSANKYSGNAPLSIEFTGKGIDTDGTITSYTWNFGDGETSNLQNPGHIYENEGTYYVTLTVKDNEGATSTESITIMVEGASILSIRRDVQNKISDSSNELMDIFNEFGEIDVTDPSARDEIEVLAEIGQNKASRYLQDIEEMDLPHEFDLFMTKCREYFDYWGKFFYYIELYAKFGGSENLNKAGVYMDYLTDSLIDMTNELSKIN